jgi:RNA polymerase sigma factor (sigma-70 family)
MLGCLEQPFCRLGRHTGVMRRVEGDERRDAAAGGAAEPDWFRRLRDSDRALAYVRQTVVNLCRSRLRRRLVVRRHLTAMVLDGARGGASMADGVSLERHSMIEALQKLPPRRREALVWRYFGDLSVEQTAQAMGVTAGAVKSACARGLAELAGLLGDVS